MAVFRRVSIGPSPNTHNQKDPNHTRLTIGPSTHLPNPRTFTRLYNPMTLTILYKIVVEYKPIKECTSKRPDSWPDVHVALMNDCVNHTGTNLNHTPIKFVYYDLKRRGRVCWFGLFRSYFGWHLWPVGKFSSFLTISYSQQWCRPNLSIKAGYYVNKCNVCQIKNN